MSWDTAETGPVSHVTGHRDVGQNTRPAVAEVEQQHAHEPPSGALVSQLIRYGLDQSAAEALIHDYGEDLIEAALDALPWERVRNPAGWLGKAVRDGWAVEALQRRQREQEPTPRVPDYQPPSVEPEGLAHQAWAAFAVTVLDDGALAEAVGKVTTPVAGLGRRSAPAVIGELGGWAAKAFGAARGGSLRDALAEALPDAGPVPYDPSLSMIELPAVEVSPDWKSRLADAVRVADARPADVELDVVERSASAGLEATR